MLHIVTLPDGTLSCKHGHLQLSSLRAVCRTRSHDGIQLMRYLLSVRIHKSIFVDRMQLRRPPGTKLLWDEEIGQGNL